MPDSRAKSVKKDTGEEDKWVAKKDLRFSIRL